METTSQTSMFFKQCKAIMNEQKLNAMSKSERKTENQKAYISFLSGSKLTENGIEYDFKSDHVEVNGEEVEMSEADLRYFCHLYWQALAYTILQREIEATC